MAKVLNFHSDFNTKSYGECATTLQQNSDNEFSAILYGTVRITMLE